MSYIVRKSFGPHIIVQVSSVRRREQASWVAVVPYLHVRFLRVEATKRYGILGMIKLAGISYISGL